MYLYFKQSPLCCRWFILSSVNHDIVSRIKIFEQPPQIVDHGPAMASVQIMGHSVYVQKGSHSFPEDSQCSGRGSNLDFPELQS